jgi:hypothetical protein
MPGSSLVVPGGSSVIPVVSGAIPVVSGAIPVVSGVIPVVSGAIPVVSGAIPVVSGAIPVVSGAIPSVSGAIPSVSGAFAGVSGALPPWACVGICSGNSRRPDECANLTRFSAKILAKPAWVAVKSRPSSRELRWSNPKANGRRNASRRSHSRSSTIEM